MRFSPLLLFVGIVHYIDVTDNRFRGCPALVILIYQGVQLPVPQKLGTIFLAFVASSLVCLKVS